MSVYLKEESSLSSLNSLCLVWEDQLKFCTRTPTEEVLHWFWRNVRVPVSLAYSGTSSSGMWDTKSRRYEVALDLER